MIKIVMIVLLLDVFKRSGDLTVQSTRGYITLTGERHGARAKPVPFPRRPFTQRVKLQSIYTIIHYISVLCGRLCVCAP